MEKEQAKTKGIVYDGICQEINGKAIFMRQCICYEGCLERIVEKLQDESVAQKLKYSGLYRKGMGIARLMLHEDDLELLFDELYQGRMMQLLKKAENPLWEVYALPMSMNGERIRLDVTCLLVYGVMINERCREALKAMAAERDAYYGYYEASEYKGLWMEGFLRAEQIWDARLMLGLLEKMRKEEDEDAYRLLMKVIYAGYGHIRRQIRGRKEIDGGLAREILARNISEENSMLPTVSAFILLMAMAEDLGIRYIWDYETLVMIQFFESSIDLLTNGEGAHARYEEFGAEDRKEFLEKYDEEYATHRSLLGLVAGQETDRLGELMTRVFDLYRISPRKFWNFDLTEEEEACLIRQHDRWSKRTYATGLILAQLCKYIRQLEEQYLAASRDYAGMQVYLARQEKEKACRQSQQREQKLLRLTEDKRALEDTVLKQEQELLKLQKQLDTRKEQEAGQLQELMELRSYVYSLSEGWEETEPEVQPGAMLSGWKDKRVLVVGGHVGWQNKLRELFPRWQFVQPGQNSLDGSVIKGKDLIICNTQVLAHSCYYKVLSGRDRRQKLYYVHSNNIQKCLRELELQLLA